MAIEIERVGTIQNTLGEGPVWDTAEKALYWVDGTAAEIYRLDPVTSDFKSWKVPAAIGSFALREKGGAVLALENGFHLFDFSTGKATAIIDPEAGESRTRFNDGKVDARGRFVAGTLDAQLGKPIGSLYSLDANLKCTKLDRAICCSNGPCWSPDNRTFYFSDSVIRTIFAYDYDLATGGVSNRRVFAKTEDLGGVPDGCTVDAEGHVWSAIAGGGKIACFNPDGKLGRTVAVPPRLVTSVMFGGEQLDILYATSLSMEVLEMKPGAHDGGLFAIKGLGVKGKPEPRFAG
jgi:sugar lactone lactonase YvrE